MRQLASAGKIAGRDPLNKQHTRNWTKHFDFIVLDMLCLQLCFMLSYWAYIGFKNPYEFPVYQYQAIVLTLSQLFVIVFTDNYHGILRRKRFEELMAILRYSSAFLVVAIVYLFMVRNSAMASRMQFGLTIVFYIPINYILRQLNKRRIYRFSKNQRKSMVLVTSKSMVPAAMEKLQAKDSYQEYFISGIILLDPHSPGDIPDYGLPVKPLDRKTIIDLSHKWVDEAFILQPDNMPVSSRLLGDLVEMGITVNYAPSVMDDERWPVTGVRDLSGYKVLTGGIRFLSAGEVALKRLIDILGSLVGCFLTGIIFIFVAPAIYAKSPGPIFFKQERVGRNGKVFKMYKFRSMYLDAEERKAELMEKNKMQGLMFKVDDDPRIIGSEKKRRDGKPGGIGNFIRRTSLDEFPQFFNVLKGDMSLVGTRPPTLDEWERYELEHRVRMSVKPGITGLWQVSGRSQITDFNEVVRLDRDYIENWSISLDAIILIKTIVVVFKRKGAE